jgi:hypothetical protein
MWDLAVGAGRLPRFARNFPIVRPGSFCVGQINCGYCEEPEAGTGVGVGPES